MRGLILVAWGAIHVQSVSTAVLLAHRVGSGRRSSILGSLRRRAEQTGCGPRRKYEDPYPLDAAAVVPESVRSSTTAVGLWLAKNAPVHVDGRDIICGPLTIAGWSETWPGLDAEKATVPDISIFFYSQATRRAPSRDRKVMEIGSQPDTEARLLPTDLASKLRELRKSLCMKRKRSISERITLGDNYRRPERSNVVFHSQSSLTTKTSDNGIPFLSTPSWESQSEVKM
jgi:hypothetical protein